MKHRPQISSTGWALLCSSVLLLSAVWTLKHRLRPIRWAGDPEVVALVAERDAHSGSSDVALDALRAKARTAVPSSWSTEQLKRFETTLPPGWACAWQVAPPAGCRAVLTRRGTGLTDWPACMALVQELSPRPGLVIESVEILARGTAHRRQISRMAITLRFHVAVATNDNAERAAPAAARSPLSAAFGRPRPGRSGALLRSAVRPPPPSLRLPDRPPLRFGPTLRVPGPGRTFFVSENQIRT